VVRCKGFWWPGRAISVVLLATAAGAIAGPNLASPTETLADALSVLASAGPFAVAVIAHVIAAVILLVLLRPDPLLASRDAAEEVAEPAAGWRGPQESALLAATCLDRSRRDGRVERRDGRRDDDDSYGWPNLVLVHLPVHASWLNRSTRLVARRRRAPFASPGGREVKRGDAAL